MSNYLLDYQKAFDNYTHSSEIEGLFMLYVEQEIPIIKQWIKDRWLKGERVTGDIIGKYSSSSYELYKASLGRTGAVDLTYTGDMGNKLDFLFNKYEVEIISQVSYYDKIVEQYGSDNFNITQEETEVLLDVVISKIFNGIFSDLWGA